jgi:hypothetical protein
MTEYRKYRRTQIAEMKPWSEGDDMSEVSISRSDKENGSPRTGDMIARNPANHADRWLVSAAYFAANFEPAEPDLQTHRGADARRDRQWRLS